MFFLHGHYLLAAWPSCSWSCRTFSFGVVSLLAFTHSYLLVQLEQSRGPSLDGVFVVSIFFGSMTSSDSLPAEPPLHLLAYRGSLYSFLCRGGSPQFTAMSLCHTAPLTPEGPSVLFQVRHTFLRSSSTCARLDTFSALLRGVFNDAAGFTLCYGLDTCSPSL